jgi:hypothetical protein
MNNSLIHRLGGRKFALTVGLVACAIAAVAFDVKVDPMLLDFVKWIVGLFMAGNVGKSAFEKKAV